MACDASNRMVQGELEEKGEESRYLFSGLGKQMLDAIISEDDCETFSQNGNKTLSIVRKLALLLHKRFIEKQPENAS